MKWPALVPALAFFPRTCGDSCPRSSAGGSVTWTGSPRAVSRVAVKAGLRPADSPMAADPTWS